MSQEHQIKIEALYKDLMTQGLVKSKKTVKAFGDEAEKSGGRVKSLGSHLKNVSKGPLRGMAQSLKSTTLQMVGFAAATAAVGKGTRIFLETEKALAEVATISPEVANNIDGIGASVSTLALRFGVAESAVSKGLYQTISAGVSDPTAALETLNVALGLSLAGVADTTETTDLLVGTMNSFGDEAGNASNVADVMFATVRRGKTTIGELAQSMSMVTPTAAALGVSMEETNAAVATLTLSGAPTSVAVTQVGAALNALLTKSADVNDALKTAGSSGKGFDLVRLRSEGLIPILEDLRQTYDGNEDALASLLGRKEAQLAVFGLTGDKASVYADILGDVTESTGDYEAALSRMATTSSTVVASAIEGIRQGLGLLGEGFIEGMLGEDGLTGGLDGAQTAAESLKETFADLAPLAQLVGKAVHQMAEAIKAASFISADSEFQMASVIDKQARSEWKAGQRTLEDYIPIYEALIKAAETARVVGVGGIKGTDVWREELDLMKEVVELDKKSAEIRKERAADTSVASIKQIEEGNALRFFNGLIEDGRAAWSDNTSVVTDYWDSVSKLNDELAETGDLTSQISPPALPGSAGGTFQFNDPGMPQPAPGGVGFKPTPNYGVGPQGPMPVGPAPPLPPPAPTQFPHPDITPAGGLTPEQMDAMDLAAAPKGATKAFKDLEAQIAKTAETQEAMTNHAIDSFAGGMTNAIMDFASGAKSAEDAFGDFAASFLSEMAAMILQQQIFNAISAAAGGFSSGGTAKGGVGGMTALASGGVVGGGLIGYASGGPIVTKPHVALIGEGRHNEAVVPMPGGKEIPVNLRGGGGGGDVSINITAMDGKDAKRVLIDEKDTIRTIIQEAMMTNNGFRGTMQGARA